VANVHVAAEERDGDVTFLRTVEEGATDRSYGIHVADLAGVPGPVVSRASAVLDRLREEKAIEAKGGSGGEPVQAVFDLGSGQFDAGGGSEAAMETVATEEAASDGGGLDPELEAVLDELRGTDVNDTSPLELMGKVQEWQRRLDTE
jgi:DNA mismatch repair protein MutS